MTLQLVPVIAINSTYQKLSTRIISGIRNRMRPTYWFDVALYHKLYHKSVSLCALPSVDMTGLELSEHEERRLVKLLSLFTSHESTELIRYKGNWGSVRGNI